MVRHFFLLIIILPTWGMCQDIYITGNITSQDCSNISLLVNTINNTFKPKSISLFYQNSKVPFFIFQRKKNNSKLNNKLYDLIGIKSSIPNLEEIERKKIELESYYNYKKYVISYNKNSNYAPPSNYNDFNKLLLYLKDPLNRREKFVFLLYFTKEKPSIKITKPQEKESVSKIIVEGTSGGNSPIAEVLIRVNNGIWNKASGTANWKLEIPIKGDNTNNIDAIAIDNENDTSLMATVNDILVLEKSFTSSSINYIYPEKYANIVPKCLVPGSLCYNFKISADPEIKLENITFNIENSVNEPIIEKSLIDIDSTLRPLINRTGSDEYCFFLVYSFFKFHSPCAINDEEDYYYYYKYKVNGKTMFSTNKILIHFTSFDPSYDEKHCECE